MKKLTKIFTIAAIAFVGVQANAQSVGIKAGFNLSDMNMYDDDDSYNDDFDMKPGFHAGFIVDVPLNSFLTFQSGLMFTTKGVKQTESGDGFDYKFNLNLQYLDIPLTIKASHELSSSLKMFGTVGPYVGVGILGKFKSELTIGKETEKDEEDVEWGSDEVEDDFKRLDMGAVFGVGVEINSLILGVTYNLGLMNISPYQDNGSTLRNNVLQFSVGYLLGR